MGEETDIAEPMSTEYVVAAEDVIADEPSKEHRRKRKKHLHKCLRELIEFYMGDVNLSKDRFMSQRLQGQPFVYVDISIFLKFNKVKALTSSLEEIAEALSKSEIIQLSEDKTQICRKTPILKKENEEECTIYVEQLAPDVDHDLLTKWFSEFGPVDYVSLPRFSHNNKFKGFAFVEFRDPESAKNALEAFKIKGSRLSPHMAPEDLMSIKNFDRNKENKTMEHSEKIDKSESDIKEVNGPEDNNHTRKNKLEVDGAEKEKKKRKISEGNEKALKKLKKNYCKDAEINNSGKKGNHICGDKIIKREEEKIEKTSNQIIVGKLETVEQHSTKSLVSDINNKPSNLKKLKRKYIEEPSSTQSESKLKKPKAEVEDECLASQSEEDNGEEELTKQKKKRKKKKKVKKDKSTAITLGLKVLPKKEWKTLRNQYLDMQRKMMGSLKQHLIHSKYEKNKSAGADLDDVSNKSTPKLKAEPGTVIKVTLEGPVTSLTTAKSEMRIHPDVRYVDVTEGSPVVYLRAATPQLAASLVQSRQWPAMELIQGDEETEYWKKMDADREENLRKNKPNQRGRKKLLKRAEKFQGKHIATFESS